MSALLALASAVAYGASDFLGGVGSRRGGAFAVAVAAQVAGTGALLAVIGLLPGAPDQGTTTWGAVAGVGGGLGLALYFRALAIGPMSVVSPVTAALGASVPLTVGLLGGERPGPTALLGAGLAVAAVALVSVTRRRDHDVAPLLRALPLAVGAALGFGLFFVALAQTSTASGVWPLLVARAVSVPLLLVGGLATRRALLPPRHAVGIAICSGVADMLANALYLFAVRGGLLSLTAVLASLYPVPTVLLAGSLLRERLDRRRWLGVALAVLAVALIATP